MNRSLDILAIMADLILPAYSDGEEPAVPAGV